MYSNQPLPYSSYGTPPTANMGSLQSGYISPPESRRTLEEEKEKQAPPQQRQSLPSIHEALGNDNPLPYHGPPTSAAPQQQVHHAPPPHSSSPGFVGCSGGEAPTGPPNPFSNPAFSHHHHHHQQLQAEASRSSLTSLNTSESRNASLNSLSSGKSPTQSERTAVTSISGSQNSGYEYSAPASAGSVASPNSYTPQPPFSQSFSFQSQPPLNTQSYHSAHYDARPYSGTPWKSAAPEPARVEEMRNGYAGRPALPGHADSVKRHLDIYDVETSLNEVSIFFSSLPIESTLTNGPRLPI